MVGCCEPGLAWLGGQRLFNTMRCQGNEAHKIYSTRYTTLSEDGGMTWSEPVPLVYDDGTTVWTPVSIAVFDPERLCVLRDTIRVIQDLPEGAPMTRRYTNFSMSEERGTGDLMLLMPEQPKHMGFEEMTKAEDFEADCIRFRVRFVE